MKIQRMYIIVKKHKTMKTKTQNIITIGGKEPELHSEGVIEVVSEKLKEHACLDLEIEHYYQSLQQ